MAFSQWWSKTLSSLSRAQDEIVKVSQMGKIYVDRSFLIHERNKLFRKLGEISYQCVKAEKVKTPELSRLADQIDRMGKRIDEMKSRMKDLTHAVTLKLDAEQETDHEIKREVSKKKVRMKKK
jgi:uncharacterized protein YoxC